VAAVSGLYQIHRSRLIQLFLLTLAVWAANYFRYALGPLQETMRADLGMTDHAMSWLQGPAVELPMAIFAIPLGLMLDRSSKAKLFWIFTSLGMAALLVMSFSTNLVVIFASRAIVGIAKVTLLIAAYAVVADLYPPAQRGRATMVVALGEIGGASSAFAIGGSVLTHLAGQTAGTDVWRQSIMWMMIPIALAAICTTLIRAPGASEKNQTRITDIWPSLWRYKEVMMPLMAARSMVWAGEGAIFVWGAPALSRAYAASPAEVGAIMGGAVFIAGLAGPLLGGLLADFCQKHGGPRTTMSALSGLALICAPIATFSIAPSLSTAAVLLTLFLTLGYVFGTAALTLGTIVMPSALRGVYLAVTNTVAAICMGLAPLFVTALSEPPNNLGIGKALAIICCVTSIIGAFVFGWSRKHFTEASIPAEPQMSNV